MTSCSRQSWENRLTLAPESAGGELRLFLIAKGGRPSRLGLLILCVRSSCLIRCIFACQGWFCSPLGISLSELSRHRSNRRLLQYTRQTWLLRSITGSSVIFVLVSEVLAVRGQHALIDRELNGVDQLPRYYAAGKLSRTSNYIDRY